MAIESRADKVMRQTEARIKWLLTGSPPTVRANLAQLRHGAGGRPGDDPRLWGVLFSDLPEEFLGSYGEPSWEEWAIYTALTLFAVHEQGGDFLQEEMLDNGVSLGLAAARLVRQYGGEDSRERVARRFNQVALAADMPSMTFFLRGFVQILRAEGIGLDYAKLARDLYRYQQPEGAQRVRLEWGQDFYRIEKEERKDEVR